MKILKLYVKQKKQNAFDITTSDLTIWYFGYFRLFCSVVKIKCVKLQYFIQALFAGLSKKGSS